MASKIIYKGGTNIETVSGDELKIILPKKGSYHQWPQWWDKKEDNVRYNRFAIIEAIVPSGDFVRLVMPVRDGGQHIEIFYDGIGNFQFPAQRPLNHGAVYNRDGTTLFRTYDFTGGLKSPVKTKVYSAYTNSFLTDNNAPIFQKAEVGATGKDVEITYDEELTALAASAFVNFKVKVGVADAPIKDLLVIKNKIFLAMKDPIAKGATVKLSYTKPTSGDATAVRDDAAVNNESISLNEVTVTNNSKSDGIAPKMTSLAVGTDGMTGIFQFSEEMQNGMSKELFTFRAGGRLYGLETFALQSDSKNVLFKLNEKIPKGAAITLEYIQVGSRAHLTAAKDLSDVEVATSTINGSNGSTFDLQAPVLVSGTVRPYPDVIDLLYNEEIAADDDTLLPSPNLFTVLVKRGNQENTVVPITIVRANATTYSLSFQNPIAFPDDEVYVSYNAPTSGKAGFQDRAGNLAPSLDKVKMVNKSARDIIAPTISQAIVTPDGNRVMLTLNEAAPTRNIRAQDFAITIDNATVQPLAVASADRNVSMIVPPANKILKHQKVTLAYVDTTPNDTGDDVVDVAGNKLARFGSINVVNNSNAIDTAAPVLDGAPTVAANGLSISLKFDQALAGTPLLIYLSIYVDGQVMTGLWTTGISHDPNTNPDTLTLGINGTHTIKQGEVIRVKYVAPTSLGDSIRDLDDNKAVSFDVAATNNSVVSGTQPAYQSSVVDGAGMIVYITYDIPLRSSDPPALDKFTVKHNTIVNPVTGLLYTNGNKTLGLVLANAIEKAQAVTVDYADPTTGDDVKAVQSAAGVDAAALTNKTVLNNSDVPRYSQATSTFGGREVWIVFTDPLDITQKIDKTKFGITAKPSSSAQTSNLKIESATFITSQIIQLDLEDDSIIGKGDVVKLNYTRTNTASHSLVSSTNSGASVRTLKDVAVVNNSDQDSLVAHYGAAQDVFTDLNFAKDKSLAHRRIADVFNYVATGPSYYVNENGYLAKTKANYVRHSDNFNDSTYTTLTGLVVAPDELPGPGFPHVYCQTLKEDRTNSQHKMSIKIPSGITAGQAYIVSFYVKAQDPNANLVIEVDALHICAGTFQYDLKADAFKAGAQGTTSSSTSFTWKLLTVRGVAPSHSGDRFLNIALGNGTSFSYQGRTGGCVDFYGLQINEGTVPVTQPIISYSLPGHEPRFQHHPETKASMGLLLEPSTYNLMSTGSQGNSFNQWTYTDLTAAHNSTGVLDPKGTNLATRWTEASNNNEKKAQFNITVQAQKYYAFSMYVKSPDREMIKLDMPASHFKATGTQHVTWDITGDRVLSKSGTFDAAKVEKCINGWVRISCRFFCPKSTAQNVQAQITLLNSSGATGSGGKVVYVWGVQLEEDKFEASTYIEANRNASILSIPKHEIARTNLAKQSENLLKNQSDALWIGHANVTTTRGTSSDFTDPNGGKTATKVEFAATSSGTGAFLVQGIKVKEFTDYVMSFYVKPVPSAPSTFPADDLNFYWHGDGFNNNVKPLITPMGDWERVSVPIRTPDIPNIGGSQEKLAIFGVTCKAAGSFMMWGFQVEEGRYLTPYVKSDDSLQGPNDLEYIGMDPSDTTYRVRINKNDDFIWESHGYPSVIMLDDNENVSNTHIKLGVVDVSVVSGDKVVTTLGWENTNKGTRGWISAPEIPTQHNIQDDYLILLATVKAGNSQLWSNDVRYGAETSSNLPEISDITFEPTSQAIGRITIYKKAITDPALLKTISNPAITG